QRYQEIRLSVRSDERHHSVWEPRLRGRDIRFTVVDGDLAHRFEGEIEGAAMRGTVRTGVGSAEVTTPFAATRTGALHDDQVAAGNPRRSARDANPARRRATGGVTTAETRQ